MTRRIVFPFLFSLSVCWIVASAFPAEPEASGPPDSAQTEDKPPPRIRLGFTERVRLEGWNNTVSLDNTAGEARIYTRVRTSLSLTAAVSSGLEFAVKVTNENRYYFAPENIPFKTDEIFIDNLYLAWNRPGGLPLRLTAGRWNMMLGEGFVVAEGGPLDGSRSVYFNGLRTDWDLVPGRTTLTAFVVHQPETDGLPVLDPKPQAMVEQPETGAGLYLTAVSGKGTWEPYLLYKLSGAVEMNPEAAVATGGLRATIPLIPGVKVRGEAAYQTGTRGDARVSAFGGYAFADFHAEKGLPAPVDFSLGAIWLSGDDTTTDRHEGWDPVFSRWPKWSDSLIYTMIREDRVAYWSNFISPNATLAVSLHPKVRLSLTAHRMWADKPGRPSPFLSGTGRDRGTLVIARTDFEVVSGLTGHLIFEHFRPGDFYRQGASSAGWLRFELLYRI
jgi:hypothetical protein